MEIIVTGGMIIAATLAYFGSLIILNIVKERRKRNYRENYP